MEQGDRVTYSPSIVHGYSHLPMVAASLNLTFVYLNFVDEVAIMEQRSRFGGIRMVWTRNTDIAPGKSGSLM